MATPNLPLQDGGATGSGGLAVSRSRAGTVSRGAQPEALPLEDGEAAMIENHQRMWIFNLCIYGEFLLDLALNTVDERTAAGGNPSQKKCGCT
jgi:hypothetical protein